jgi:hypothetical protein
MDMFVYGCSRVLRYLSLLNHTVVLYCYKGILKELEISSNQFKEICIIAGTDYNTNNNLNIFTVFNYFKQYIKNNEYDCDFYKWLKRIDENIDVDIESLYKIKYMFDLCIKEYLDIYNKIKITNTQIQYNNLQNLLENNGFVFV